MVGWGRKQGDGRGLRPLVSKRDRVHEVRGNRLQYLLIRTHQLLAWIRLGSKTGKRMFDMGEQCVYVQCT